MPTHLPPPDEPPNKCLRAQDEFGVLEKTTGDFKTDEIHFQISEIDLDALQLYSMPCSSVIDAYPSYVTPYSAATLSCEFFYWMGRKGTAKLKNYALKFAARKPEAFYIALYSVRSLHWALAVVSKKSYAIILYDS